ncbi:MAG: iron-sulfur cluster-binding protein [Bacteroidales bacterium]|jgi:L-lactate dehydrogenase complex protein LldF|nr:iron-sulfur cluster-binding protein [Bacteroidales bacterium]
MTEIYNKFRQDSENKAFDREHRRKLDFNIGRYDEAVKRGKQQYANLELARQRAAAIRYRAIADLEKNLADFESNFERNGGKVIWALDAADALREIETILLNHKAAKVVKSKSMVSEEISLNDHLEKSGIEVLETDLGEYIVQQAGEHPYHIVTPAMHKSKEDVAVLFNEKFGLPVKSTPEDITAYVRKKLREKFFYADVGITGANFIIADTGSVCVTENEGNGLLSMSFPKVHIVVTGIEKVLPSFRNLDLFWPLLATHGTGQYVTAYNSLISGPRQDGETDGPKEMYVVLLDNGRSQLLARKNQRRALSCIRCGACLNTCPVYRTIGGHAYGTTYSGPIGSVITPWIKGMNEYKHMSFASSLCGSCTEVCPVKINLHELLLYNRNDSVKLKTFTVSEAFSMFAWKTIMLNRKWMDFGSPRLKNFVLNKAFSKQWGSRRKLPVVSDKNFRQLWEERKEGKSG